MGASGARAKPMRRTGNEERSRAMDLSGFNWTLLTIVGPILLALVIIYALLHNRKARNRPETEEATRRLYEQEDRADRGEGDNVP